jgi:hypothetical protein
MPGPARQEPTAQRTLARHTTVAAASGAASVRVRHITSREWDPWTERPLPEVVRVAYPLGNAFADVLDTSTQSGI